VRRGESQFGDENEVLQFQPAGDDVLAQERQVVVIGMAHFFDQTVQAQALQETRDLAAGFLGEQSTQALVLEASEIELAARQGFNQRLVLGGEKVQAPIGTFVFPNRLADLPQKIDAGRGIVEGGEKFQIAPVGGLQEVTQGRQAVDAFLHRRPPRSVSENSVFEAFWAYNLLILRLRKVCFGNSRTRS
jgi:hypothetical protein